MKAQGGDPELLLSDANQNVAPAWSADGRRVVFASDRGGPRSLWEIDVSSRRVQQLTSGTGYATTPVVSPDGSIAYTEYTHQVDLYWGRVDQPAEKHQRLTSHTHSNFGGRISPDGRRVAYHSNRTGNLELWLLDRETGAERNLTNHPAYDIMGDWSPDGRDIVFLSNREGSLQVWVIEVAGGQVRRVSRKAQVLGVNDQFSGPRWSPDGRAIGFVGVGETEQALWVVDPQGGGERAVLPAVSGFDWYRGSRIVVYTRKAGDASDTLGRGAGPLSQAPGPQGRTPGRLAAPAYEEQEREDRIHRVRQRGRTARRPPATGRPSGHACCQRHWFPGREEGPGQER
jgi:TolB protein